MAQPDSPTAAKEWFFSFVGDDPPRGTDAHRCATALFAALGDPQDQIPAVHLVGTAGKGSVAALVGSALVASGDRVGAHQSPHVHDIRERFTIDGRLPAWPEVRAAVAVVDEAVRSLDPTPKPTFFAVTAAVASVIARTARADWLMMEAGIGGRVDATNVFHRADVLTVITPIGLDHTEVLGSTAAEIAAEKGMVMAGRTDAVLAPQPHREAAEVIRQLAADLGVLLHETEPEVELDDWRGVARGTATSVLEVLGTRLGRAVAPPGELVLPGRFESFGHAGRRFVLDGAHNPMKLSGLADALHADGTPVSMLVAAVGAGKDLAGCAAAIASISDRVVTVGFGPPALAPGPRSHDPVALANALAAVGVGEIAAARSADDAASRVLDRTRPGDVVVVTGSFLHLSEMRDAIRRLRQPG